MPRLSLSKSGSAEHRAGTARCRRTLSASTLRAMSTSIFQMNGGGSSKGSEIPNCEIGDSQFESSRPVSVPGHHRAPLHSTDSHNSLGELDNGMNDSTVTEKKEENIWADRMHTVKEQQRIID